MQLEEDYESWVGGRRGGSLEGISVKMEAEMETEGPETPAPAVRQRKKPSGRVRFSEEHLAELRADSLKEKARKAAEQDTLGWGVAFCCLAVARYFSSQSNIIHDCDEVFNYWEPLHYLVYNSGLQTWEYSSEFALRSWLYILFHAVIVKPASWWYGSGAGKVEVFYFLRFCLGLASAATEATLVAGTAHHFGKRLGSYTLLLLCFTSGLFTASTSFLPSTFSMYAISLAAGALLWKKPCVAVAVSAVGVLLGWPFSVLATGPLVVYAFSMGGFVPVFLSGLCTSIVTLAVSTAVDRFFYGRWTSSVLNLVKYNVLGGGDSAIFGVEGPLFYLQNGFNNFNFALPLALLFPVLALFDKRKYGRLLVIVSPIYLWLGFMSLQQHKEERFLYPIYPLVCLAAAAVIEVIPTLVPRPRYHAPNEEPAIIQFSKVLRPITLAVILALSYSRTASLLYGYSAPMQIYRQLSRSGDTYPAVNAGDGPFSVCVGAEWHRFPSSFFLRSPSYQIDWLDDGERGLLPQHFNPALGGTASAPPYFNKHNKGFPEQFVVDERACSFLVELKLGRRGRSYRGDNLTEWEVVLEQNFLDNELSPALYRAVFIPWSWERHNTFATYRLLRRQDSLVPRVSM